jgi:hypothetical protein
MRSKSAALAQALVFMAAFLCVSAVAKTKGPDAQDAKSYLTVPMRSGAFVMIRTESVPPSERDAMSDFTEPEDKANLLHRVFVDGKNDLFFGYELLVERVASTRQFRVTVRPLSEDYLKQLRARAEFQKRRLHPSYNASAFKSDPQLINDGDTFALDVLQSQRTGTKIVDMITVSLTDPGMQEPVTDAAPRDLTLEEVQLKVTNYRLSVNGETIKDRPSGGCAGALIWFALPDRGRFIISLVPHAGYDFRKIGSIRHNTLSFDWGDEHYEWESSLPIVGTGGNWNVWVLHDPDYKLDLFDRPAPKSSGARQTSQYDDAVRRARGRQTKAELAAPDEQRSTQTSPSKLATKTRRSGVAIGASDIVEYLFPK